MSDPSAEDGDTRMADHREARSQLRRAWTPFFARYGSLLMPQVSAIPPVMDGKNVVVCAATASGKTEAVVAPTAERFLADKWGSMSIVYVIPTRALANDTLLRIQGPLEDLGISVALKHGDKPLFNPRKPPDWLVTTPESLDSLLCRHTESLQHVRTVILDELHLLDNTYRGDQLRILLRRLRHHSTVGGFNTHALSATLGDPADVAQRYVDNPVIVSVPGKRTIHATLLESPLQVRALAPSRGWRKALFFCNKRATVEETAKDIASQWAPYAVVAHHGSLDRQLREKAEKVMKEERVAACVCTSTLEVGIDIGDVDVVVLVEIPYSLSTLLQRLGRGNRRSDHIDAVVVVQNDEERMVAEEMLRAAEVGGTSACRVQAGSLRGHPAGLLATLSAQRRDAGGRVGSLRRATRTCRTAAHDTVSPCREGVAAARSRPLVWRDQDDGPRSTRGDPLQHP
jgi:ATP-dependent Lhr-like helicase